MILLRNSDVPGVIGDIGKILGDNNINIADFRLSRGKDSALAVILVDNNITHDILKKLESLEAAISVSYAEI
jgi:D-3-phosphoglycerate dehydrogenase